MEELEYHKGGWNGAKRNGYQFAMNLCFLPP